jgi:hypothetical protein
MRPCAPVCSRSIMIMIRMQVEDGLSIDPDKPAVLIQSVLDDKRGRRGTRRLGFDLTPVGSRLRCTPSSSCRGRPTGCARHIDPWRSVVSERPSSRSERQALAARRRIVRIRH